MTLPHPTPLIRHARRASRPVQLGLVAVAVAAVSLLITHDLNFDPQGWLQWGREIVLGDGSFSTIDYPSWKPLPLLFTAPLALTGPLAPYLWLVLIRASGLLALAGIFRLGARVGGVKAGILSVAALALVPGWWHSVIGGHIEPLLLCLGLLAIERHRAGRHGYALALAALAALGRPEAWILLVAYGAVLATRDRRFAWTAGALALAAPALWIGGDWIGSGDPFHGGVLASQAADAIHQRLHGSVTTFTLGIAGDLFVLPLWCAAAVGLAAAVRERHRMVLLLALAGFGWIALDVAMTKNGYPGELRFMLPAAGMLAVVVGTGASAVLELARRRVAPRVAMAVAIAAVPQAVTAAFIHQTPPPIPPKLPVRAAGDTQTDLVRPASANSYRFQSASRRALLIRLNQRAVRRAGENSYTHRAR